MAVRVDGKAIAAELKEEISLALKEGGYTPVLTVFVLTEDLATQKFISLKQGFAHEVGVEMRVVRLRATVETAELVQAIQESVEGSHGIIVQFPLPPHLDRNAVRNAVPADRDVDLISDEALRRFAAGGSTSLPPVVGAIREVFLRHGISLAGKRVVVVGEGRLVGGPAALWARQQGAWVETINEQTADKDEVLKAADIVILGAGVPGLLTPQMIKEGVVIIDAGTSEASGKLAGDMDPACSERAALYTPVPGGIGPITVAMIFKNLLVLLAEQR